MDFATLNEMVRENINSGMNAVTLYLSIVSAYLVVAYLVGKKMSFFQMMLATTLFVVFASFFSFGTFGFFNAAHLLSARFGPELDFPVLSATYAWIICIAQTLGILGSLVFMLHERQGGDT